MPGKIGVFIDREFQELVDRQWVRKIVRRVLQAEKVPSPYEVSLVITDSGTVRRLNRDYRGVDQPTDVLAFSMHQQEADFILPPDNVLRLGEVVISYPRAAEQAREQGHSTARELALLVIHGMLHLLGYDHDKPEEGKKMRARRKSFWRTSLKWGCN